MGTKLDSIFRMARYLYDVSLNEWFMVGDYVTSGGDCFQMKNAPAEKSLSDYSNIYQMENGTYIAYVLDVEHAGEDDPPKHGNIKLVIEEDEELEYYMVFR